MLSPDGSSSAAELDRTLKAHGIEFIPLATNSLQCIIQSLKEMPWTHEKQFCKHSYPTQMLSIGLPNLSNLA